MAHAVHATEVADPTSATAHAEASQVPVRGAHRSAIGPVYFDGAAWFAATDLGGLWIPDAARPLPEFDPTTADLELISAEPGPASVLPRGPLPGPDYDPRRDCGNCGFEIVDRAAPCPHCGSTSTGPVFTPGG